MANLREKVSAEEENINQTLNDLQSALARPERTIIERAALATFLHNIYSGIENILKQILKAKGVSIPSSPSWHKDLLILTVSEKIISQDLANDIFPYLTFRHLFVHVYGFMLDDEEIIKLATKIPEIYSRFAAEVESALQNFEKPTTLP
ncbi:hypothetical protein L0337_44650 [candidate division KSB1 bacterium]|nr:hypothetical protein [candidate division KSB1 bacterium]